MTEVINGRMTAEVEGDFVVFLLGMRINKPWKLHKWIPVARAMSPMIRELNSRRELGLMGFHSWIGSSGTMLVQYWRSMEALESYAKDAQLQHRPAWRRFYKVVGMNGDVGIWHETYAVRDGGFEAIYGNMPQFGLAEAGKHVPLTAKTRYAADRRAANTH